MSAYVRACRDAGGQPDNWRTPEFCPPAVADCRTAETGLEWRECGSGESRQCGQGADLEAGHFCIEGCYCPQGTRLHDNRSRASFKLQNFLEKEEEYLTIIQYLLLLSAFPHAIKSKAPKSPIIICFVFCAKSLPKHQQFFFT